MQRVILALALVLTFGLSNTFAHTADLTPEVTGGAVAPVVATEVPVTNQETTAAMDENAPVTVVVGTPTNAEPVSETNPEWWEKILPPVLALLGLLGLLGGSFLAFSHAGRRFVENYPANQSALEQLEYVVDSPQSNEVVKALVEGLATSVPADVLLRVVTALEMAQKRVAISEEVLRQIAEGTLKVADIAGRGLENVNTAIEEALASRNKEQ